VAPEDELLIPELLTCNPTSMNPACPFKFLRIPVRDNGLEPLGTYLSEAFEFIQDSKSNNVLIHCAEGKSRSPSLILSYLIASKRMNLAEAFNLLKKIRPIVQPRYQLFQELLELEKIYYGENSMSHNDNYVPILLPSQ
jgi:protein-tyrosine phosphatase